MSSEKCFSDVEIAAIKMTLRFLEELSDIQGSAGCNDMSIENTDEHWAMLSRAVYANGDKNEIKYFEEDGRPEGKNIRTMDISVRYACELFLKDMLQRAEQEREVNLTTKENENEKL
jgi:hypothetical protein